MQSGFSLAKKSGLTTDTASSHQELVTNVQEYSKADYIVLDGPPRIVELTKVILILADLCLIPVGASAAELWVTNNLLALVTAAKQVKAINARIVCTRYRPNTQRAQELSELATKELGLAALTKQSPTSRCANSCSNAVLGVSSFAATCFRLPSRFPTPDTRRGATCFLSKPSQVE